VNVQVVDDVRDDEELLFGGGGPVYAEYFDDLWAFAPSFAFATFVAEGLPAGAAWSVSMGDVGLTTHASLLRFFQPVGSYRYAYVVQAPAGGNVTLGSGTLVLPPAGTRIAVVIAALPGRSSPAATWAASTFLALGILTGGMIGVGVVLALRASREAERREGEWLVSRLETDRSGHDPNQDR